VPLCFLPDFAYFAQRVAFSFRFYCFPFLLNSHVVLSQKGLITVQEMLVSYRRAWRPLILPAVNLA